MDERYMISEASKRVDVEDHVLRYWEEVLELPIERNELGHRYYKETDIEKFKLTKKLKEQGFQLKAIKLILANYDSMDLEDTSNILNLKEELNERVFNMENEEKLSDTMEGTSLITGEEEHAIEEETTDKMSQFKALMTDIILSALKENNSSLSSEISTNVTEGVIKEISYLERLREEKEEERFRKLDATLRDYQKSRMQVAASSNRKKSKFFKKNNRVYI